MLPEGQQNSTRRSVVRGAIVLLELVGFLAGWATIAPFSFGHYSICSRCGMKRDTVGERRGVLVARPQTRVESCSE